MNRQKKEELKQMDKIQSYKIAPGTIVTTDGLSSIATTVSGPAFAMMPLFPKQETKKMFIQENDPHYSARDRLSARAYEAHSEHITELRKKHYLDDHDTREWSVQDAIDAIKNDKFVLRRPDESKKKGSYYYSGFDIRFRDPSKPADDEGYKADRKKLDASYESILDHIAVQDPKDAHKKVDSFREKFN